MTLVPELSQRGHPHVVPQDSRQVLELLQPVFPFPQAHVGVGQQGLPRRSPLTDPLTAAQDSQDATGPHCFTQHSRTLKAPPTRPPSALSSPTAAGAVRDQYPVIQARLFGGRGALLQALRLPFDPKVGVCSHAAAPDGSQSLRQQLAPHKLQLLCWLEGKDQEKSQGPGRKR